MALRTVEHNHKPNYFFMYIMCISNVPMLIVNIILCDTIQLLMVPHIAIYTPHLTAMLSTVCCAWTIELRDLFAYCVHNDVVLLLLRCCMVVFTSQQIM